MTRKEYNKLEKTLTAKLEEVTAKLEEASVTSGASLEKIEDWNDLHDAQWGIEQELESLERSWRTRNWGASEWISWELISQNID